LTHVLFRVNWGFAWLCWQGLADPPRGPSMSMVGNGDLEGR
jgi:hypothetical protein